MPPDSAIRRVTFAGLGQMGEALHALAVRGGYEVVGVDPRRAGELLAGRPVVGQLDDAPPADCLCLCLPGPVEYLAAVDWIAGLALPRRPHTLVNLTTVGPAATAEAMRTLEDRCPEVLHAECLMTGGVRRAREGACTLLYGSSCGPPPAGLRDLLTVLGGHVVLCADPVEAATAKLVNNVAAVAVALGTLEALGFGASAGLSVDLMFEVLRHGTAASYPLENTVHRAVVEGDLQTGFATRLALKDMLLALDAGRALGREMPYTEQAIVALQRAVAAGSWDASFATAALCPELAQAGPATAVGAEPHGAPA